MRRIVWSFVLAIALGGSAGAGAEEVFLKDIPDLPLMAGLSEVTEAGMSYDKPAGRIVRAYAVGGVADARVVAFYAETLPALGWRAESETRYRREGEFLTIGLSRREAMLVVEFNLQPE